MSKQDKLDDIHALLSPLEEECMTTVEYQIWQIINDKKPTPVPSQCHDNSDSILSPESLEHS